MADTATSPAFPRVDRSVFDVPRDSIPGMSLRAYLGGQALQAVVAVTMRSTPPPIDQAEFDEMGAQALTLADAFLTALEA